MRSFTLAFVSSLLLSSATATYPHQAESHAVEANSQKHTDVWTVASDNTAPDNKVAVHHPHGVIDHNTRGRRGFRCEGGKFFTQAKLDRAGSAACPKISDNKQDSKFPAVLTAFEYPPYPSPYFEWPINRYGGFFNIFHKYGKSKYRVVVASNCKVVGVVKRNSDRSYEKCTPEYH